MRAGVFLFALDRFPLFKHCAGVARFARAEHMRMPPDEFVRYVSNYLLNAEPAGFACDLSMHYHEQQKIAEFLAKMRVVLRARGLGRFVCLLNERGQQ